MSKRGKLIVIESLGDNFGKTTLVNEIIKTNYSMKTFSFPNRKKPLGQVIDIYLKDKVNLFSEKDPISVASLYLTDMRLTMEEEINVLLDKGINVLLDRYYLSTVLYETALVLMKEEDKDIFVNKNSIKFLSTLNILISHILKLQVPDLTILLTDEFGASKVQNKVDNEFDRNKELQNSVESVGEFLLSGNIILKIGKVVSINISGEDKIRYTTEENLIIINNEINNIIR